MIRKTIEFLADESGATAIAYATIAALVSVGLVGAIDISVQHSDGNMPSISVSSIFPVSSDLETVAKMVR